MLRCDVMCVVCVMFVVSIIIYSTGYHEMEVKNYSANIAIVEDDQIALNFDDKGLLYAKIKWYHEIEYET